MTKKIIRRSYMVNGTQMTAARLKTEFACPVCLADIYPVKISGEQRMMCTGIEPHDIGELGRAITKQARNRIRQEQEDDFFAVMNGLPEELRAATDAAEWFEHQRQSRKRDESLPFEAPRHRDRLFKTE